MTENPKTFDPRRCRWDPIFCQRRDLTALKKKDQSYVDFKRTVNALQKELEACICDTDDWGVDALSACHKAAISGLFNDIQQADLDEPQRWPAERRAWIDERNIGSEVGSGPSLDRRSESLMSALELLSALTTPASPLKKRI